MIIHVQHQVIIPAVPELTGLSMQRIPNTPDFPAFSIPSPQSQISPGKRFGDEFPRLSILLQHIHFDLNNLVGGYNVLWIAVSGENVTTACGCCHE